MQGEGRMPRQVSSERTETRHQANKSAIQKDYLSILGCSLQVEGRETR